MFTSKYFNPRYWAERYWPKVGGEPVDTPNCNVGIYSQIKDHPLGGVSVIQSIVGGVSLIQQDVGIYSQIKNLPDGRVSEIEENTGGVSKLCQ